MHSLNKILTINYALLNTFILPVYPDKPIPKAELEQAPSDKLNPTKSKVRINPPICFIIKIYTGLQDHKMSSK